MAFHRTSHLAARTAFLMEAGIRNGRSTEQVVRRTFAHWCSVENIDVRGTPSIEVLRQFVRLFRQRVEVIRAEEDQTGRHDADGANRAAREAMQELVSRDVLRVLF